MSVRIGNKIASLLGAGAVALAGLLVGSIAPALADECVLDSGLNGNGWGANSLACGTNSTASNNSTAVGYSANTGANNNATAIGYESFAAAESVGVGANSNAWGNYATAVGAGASAASWSTSLGQGAATSTNMYATAIGQSAFARSYSVALGQDANADASYATAVGRGAHADFDNSAAFGYNVWTDYENQQKFGNGENTYRMTGLASDASRATQSGPLEVVTSDLNGHMATDGGYIYETLDKNQDGAAIAMAMENPDLTGDEKFGLAFNYGNFDGASAIAGSVMGVLWDNGAARFAVSGGLGYGFETQTVGGRVGGQLTW
jgi:hypothetical protein